MHNTDIRVVVCAYPLTSCGNDTKNSRKACNRAKKSTVPTWRQGPIPMPCSG